ncbi:ChrR family anti-sigma-E factor [Rhodospirillaceae bacterium SYSU D60014]|uniref:ChrR family anti-sigma-E factor n=1 Tax=Virgifigura deserti TaxID=2268457 RepID=UPI000E66E5AC
MAAHHPSEESLMAYAAGSLSEPMALLIATHLALCPGCQRRSLDYETLGGILLANLPPVEIAPDCLQTVLPRLDNEAGMAADAEARAEVESGPARDHPAPDDPVLPQPLRDVIGGDLRSLPWQWVMPGLHMADLRLGRPPTRTRLMRIRAGLALPRHGHTATEAVLVLAGGFSDEYGRCRRGDVRVSDPSVTHRQVIDADEDCLCLVVADGPVKLTGILGTIVNRLKAF